MTTPIFLDLDHALRLHHSLLERYGGTDGVRDMGLLQSAIAMPQAAYGGEYLHSDIFEMAAAYLYHVVQNHPFLDGNKRAGAALANRERLRSPSSSGRVPTDLPPCSGTEAKGVGNFSGPALLTIGDRKPSITGPSPSV